MAVHKRVARPSRVEPLVCELNLCTQPQGSCPLEIPFSYCWENIMRSAGPLIIRLHRCRSVVYDFGETSAFRLCKRQI
jgi:hypothetical protein